MKKTMMIVAALLMAAVVSAQPALTKGMEGRRLSIEELTESRYLGVQNNLDAWIMEGKKHVKQVVLTDLNLEPISVAAIAGSGDLEVLAASVTPDRTGLLLVDRSSKKRTIVLRGEVDVQTQALLGGYDTVVAYEHGRKDVCMVWGATSPTGRYNALVCVMQFNDTKQYTTYIALFDSYMHLLWDSEFPLGSLSEMLVTDEGRVVTFGEERGEGESTLVFNVLDSLRTASCTATVKCDPMQDLHLINVLGNYAVAVGTYRPESRRASHSTAGVVALSFNLDSANIVGFQLRPFQNEDMNIFLNKKTKKIQKDQMCDHIVVLGCVPTPYGAALALGRDMVIEKSSTGGSVSRDGYGSGVHMVGIDTTGHVCWVRNLRRNDMNSDGIKPPLGIASVAGKVCVVKCESPKMPAIYEISNPAKQFKQGDKGNLVVYTIDPDGNTEKLLLEKKSKQTVFRAFGRPDGTLVILSERGKRTRLCELRW